MVHERALVDLETTTDDPIRWAFVAGARILGASRATLLLRRDGERTLFPLAAIGIEPTVLSAIHVPIGEGIAGRVAERGVLLFGERDDQTFLCAPIVTDRGVEGVLNLTERVNGNHFGDDDITAVTSIAKHIAFLLQAARADGEGTPGTGKAQGASHLLQRETGLPGRETFDDMVERELARSKRAGVSFLVGLVDLHAIHAAPPNEGGTTLAVTREVGLALRHVLRRYDFVGLRRGNEFGLVLSAPVDVQEAFFSRIEGAVAEVARQLRLGIEVRIGLAACPADGTLPEDLIAQASARLANDSGIKRLSP